MTRSIVLFLLVLPGCYDAHARPAPAPAHGNGACCVTCHTDEIERFDLDPMNPCEGSVEVPAEWFSADAGVGGDAR
jgi:hypothetical protein